MEVSSSAASPSFNNRHFTYLCVIQNDEVEDVWKSHISKVISELSAANAVNTSQIFPRLYKVSLLSFYFQLSIFL